jgi:hypothetical protein
MANGNDNANTDLNNRQPDISAYESELRQIRPEFEPFELSQRVLDNVAFHDFAFYEYLLETGEGYRGAVQGLSDGGLVYIEQLKGLGVSQGALESATGFLLELEGIIKGSVIDNPISALEWNQWFRGILDPLYNVFPHIIAHLIELYHALEGEDRLQFWNGLYLEIRFRVYTAFMSGGSSINWSGWYFGANNPNGFITYWMNQIASRRQPHQHRSQSFDRDYSDYSFETFPNYSVNVGLRLVYRQQWKPLAMQKGEIVRTIPLGPGQTERVTTKIIRRRKKTSTMETVTETETTTESTESTKDSNEIVAEAAETFKWNVDAKVGASFIVTAEVSSSLGGTSDEKHKQTSSKLSESMQKAASKIRRETKVVVNTESETAFEQEHFSEISNPNNEIALTYEYHKLQQQYEVFTYLAEAQSVIFVAEYVPLPTEVNEEWVRKHDWIIARALKDESYRETLNDLIQDIDDAEMDDSRFEAMLDKATAKFATFEPNTTADYSGGLSVPDIYAEPQRVYQEQLRQKAARDRATRIRQVRRQRLMRHIRDNILYYCRAIWAEEDADQRILRYRKENRRVPIEWWLNRLTALLQGVSSWVPTGKDAPLWELVDPTGPLGYIGNYAVFGLRPLPEAATEDGESRELEPVRPPRLDLKLDLNAILSMMRAPYVDPETDTLRDPALSAFIDDASEQSKLEEEQLDDLLSYLPRLAKDLLETDDSGNIIRDTNGNVRVRKKANGDDSELENPISKEDWGEYLYRKNGTRRFLVDSNNLYLSIRTGEGAALEPFKRAHRYVDMLKAYEELEAMRRKNERRDRHMDQPDVYDPDIEKILILGDGANAGVAEYAAINEALDSRTEVSAAPVTADASTASTSVSSGSPIAGGGTDVGDGDTQ